MPPQSCGGGGPPGGGGGGAAPSGGGGCGGTAPSAGGGGGPPGPRRARGPRGPGGGGGSGGATLARPGPGVAAAYVWPLTVTLCAAMLVWPEMTSCAPLTCTREPRVSTRWSRMPRSGGRLTEAPLRRVKPCMSPAGPFSTVRTRLLRVTGVPVAPGWVAAMGGGGGVAGDAWAQAARARSAGLQRERATVRIGFMTPLLSPNTGASDRPKSCRPQVLVSKEAALRCLATARRYVFAKRTWVSRKRTRLLVPS